MKVNSIMIVIILATNGMSSIVKLANAQEDTGRRREELMAYPNVALWPDGKVFICFNGRANSQEADWIKTSMKDTWSAVANIDFQYSDFCQFPNQWNYIQINWTGSEGWGVGGNSQVGMANPTHVTLGYCSSGDCNPTEYEEAFKTTAIHEIGHALGFAHEHQRNDRFPPGKCLPPEPQRSGYTTEEAYKQAHEAWITNIAVIDAGIKLTLTYDPDSIMNYCRGISDSNDSNALAYKLGYHAADRLSVGDLYGAQQVYGNRLPYWLMSQNL